jgi:hypothetical protein
VFLGWVTLVSACTGTEGDLLRTPEGVTPPDGGTSTRPEPERQSTWQIQLTGELDTTLDVQIFTFDLTTPRSVGSALHAAGRRVFCYFSAGTRESFRDDAAAFPASSLGDALPDYPDERWVDVRDATVRSIMQQRVGRAVEAGCDGIHPSGLDAFLASTGLDFQRADAVEYARWLSGVAHARGLSIGLVQGDTALSTELVADFDWVVVWSCLATDCDAAVPFTAAGKAAFLVEYGDESRASEVCPQAEALGLSAIIKRTPHLDAFRVGCP